VTAFRNPARQRVVPLPLRSPLLVGGQALLFALTMPPRPLLGLRREGSAGRSSVDP
jgi:hypothetical protein